MATLETKIKYILEAANRLVSNDAADEDEDECCELRVTWDDSRVCVSVVNDSEVIAEEEAIGGLEAGLDLLIRNLLDLLSNRMSLDLEIRNKVPT
jgi:hypothetical protein